MDNSPPWIPDINITRVWKMPLSPNHRSQTPPEGPAMNTNTPTVKNTVHRRGGMGTMGNELRAAARLSAFGDGKKFIPLDKFRQIVSPESVQRELDSGRDTGVSSFKMAQDIFANPGYMKIFAILSLIEQVHDIELFLRLKVSDHLLPFRQASHQRSGHTAFPNSLLQGWPTFMIEAFEQYQWMFLSPVFDLSPHRFSHYIFDERVCLPFLLPDDHTYPRSEGGSSEVWKVIIDPSHTISCRREQVAQAKGVRTYAIKRLRRELDSAETFLAEVRTLKRLSRSSSQHNKQLLATFAYRGRNHLIFPWADEDLRELWEFTPPPHTTTISLSLVGDLETVQMTPTASGGQGMSQGQNWVARHDDLNPANSPWFQNACDRYLNGLSEQQRRRLDDLVFDFVLSKLHQIVYLQPKYDIGNRPLYRGYDLWSLGCLLLDFVTWMVFGMQEDRNDEDFKFAKSHTAYSCPFRRRNPLRFNVRGYPTCALSSFPDIPQLKKHVREAHKRPGDADPQVADDLESGISAEAETKLRERKPSRQVLDWNTLWTVLFPKDTVIPTREYEPVIEDHEVHGRFLKASGLFRNLLRTITSTREDAARSEIGNGPIADDWHMAQAVISQQLGFRTLTGTSSQPTWPFKQPTVSTSTRNRKRHTTKRGVKRSRAASFLTPTHDSERPRKSLRKLAPLPSRFSPDEALVSNPQTFGEPVRNSGAQIPTSPSDNIVQDFNAHLQLLDPRPPTFDPVRETENESFQLEPTLDITTEIPVALDATLATNNHKGQSYQEFGWNLETLEPMQQAGVFSLSEQDMAAFDLTQFMNDLSADGNIDFSGLGHDTGIFQAG